MVQPSREVTDMIKEIVTTRSAKEPGTGFYGRKAELAELDAWFRDVLHAEVISDLQDSLYPGRYLYGTDNHLSTEGVAVRTERIRRDLEEVLSDAK